MLEGRSQLSETSCLVYELKETDTYVMAIALIRFASETILFHTVLWRFLYQALSVKYYLTFFDLQEALESWSHLCNYSDRAMTELHKAKQK